MAIKKRHYLKSPLSEFGLILRGRRTAEIQKAARGFKIDDWVILLEWDTTAKDYTGREIHFLITGIVESAECGIEKGYCLLSFHYDLISVYDPSLTNSIQ